MPSRGATAAAATAVGMALAAFLILAVVPTVESTSAQVVVPDDPKTEPVRLERRRETLLAEGGWPRTAFLLAPAAISAVPLALARTRLGRPASVVAAVLTWLFVIATGFSIGLLYVPVAVALVVAAAIDASVDKAPDGRSE